jgi:hypothetical protein
MLYDILYLYQQFVADLPDTFLEFRAKWIDLFPVTFDTKTLTIKSDYFNRTDLGKAYERCSLDGKMKQNNLKILMDEEGGFTRYAPKAKQDDRV